MKQSDLSRIAKANKKFASAVNGMQEGVRLAPLYMAASPIGLYLERETNTRKHHSPRPQSRRTRKV